MLTSPFFMCRFIYRTLSLKSQIFIYQMSLKLFHVNVPYLSIFKECYFRERGKTVYSVNCHTLEVAHIGLSVKVI